MTITYNFALQFNKEFENQIRAFAKKANQNLDTIFELDEGITPHITIAKFEINEELSEEFKENIKKEFAQQIRIDFAGLVLLPSRKEGVWIEVRVIKSKELQDLQDKFIKLIPEGAVRIDSKDVFRPHLSIGRIKNIENINIAYLDKDILRKTDILVTPKLNYAGRNF